MYYFYKNNSKYIIQDIYKYINFWGDLDPRKFTVGIYTTQYVGTQIFYYKYLPNVKYATYTKA